MEPFTDKNHVRVVVETPKGSRCKYDFDAEIGIYRMSKVLPQGHVFPFDFGFVPGTKGEDGDPLDVLVLNDEPLGFPGVLVETRLLGVVEAEQTERDGKIVRNDRIIAVAEPSLIYQEVIFLSDLPANVVEEIENFFISYNEQTGKRFTPLGRSGPDRARRLIKGALTSPSH
jgi:inorganic pyrophosphatase